MKSGRFFVTTVFLFAIAAVLACKGKPDARSAQVVEGNRHIKLAAAVQASLASDFNMVLTSTRYDWGKLSQDRRQRAKERLAEYVSAITRTLEIDAKKGLYLTQKETLQKQLDAAMGLQKSLENFERRYGENFDPQKPKDHA